MKDRKKTFIESTKKRNENLEKLDLVRINTHINKEDKDYLTEIQKENKFRLLGDSISFIIKKNIQK
ncbi:hypothetical protein fh0823_27780 (plasmid) [Francisella halioticida]|uniref:hypothetical protein n=1 Tax=Francisella halioticida TaxID=549298 RepID=UPI001AF88E50|nr:hypothetical protein [Francisella halioticida]BCD92641.1 hypothetical protein fh0823_27780 [Francisella halioticida]